MGERGKGQCGKQESEEEEIKGLLLGIMEGYHDTVIPPLSYFSSSTSPVIEMGSSKKRRKSKDSWADRMITERKRREEMSDKYTVLQSMVPTLRNTFKHPKERIIDDTVNYIKYLEGEKERLEGLKKFQTNEPKVGKHALLRCTNPNSSVKVTVSNGATFLEIQLPSRRGSVAEILNVLEKHKAEVLDARICVDKHQLLTFTATLMLGSDGGTTIDKIRDEILTL